MTPRDYEYDYTQSEEAREERWLRHRARLRRRDEDDHRERPARHAEQTEDRVGKQRPRGAER